MLSGSDVSRYHVVADRVGNITTREDLKREKPEAFTYDARNRLDELQHHVWRRRQPGQETYNFYRLWQYLVAHERGDLCIRDFTYARRHLGNRIATPEIRT